MGLKRLSEVCKILGVTRRTLQEYHKEDLLHPKNMLGEEIKQERDPDNNNVYWYYSDEDINDLILITILREAGLKRKEAAVFIKSDNEQECLDQLRAAKASLIEKQRKLKGMACLAEAILRAAKLPAEVHEALSGINVIQTCMSQGSTMEMLGTIQGFLADATDCDEETMVVELLVGMHVEAIRRLKGAPVTDEKVKVCVESLCHHMMQLMERDESTSYTTELTEEQRLIQAAEELIHPITEEDEDELPDGWTMEDVEYINQALTVYIEELKNRTTNDQTERR